MYGVPLRVPGIPLFLTYLLFGPPVGFFFLFFWIFLPSFFLELSSDIYIHLDAIEEAIIRLLVKILYISAIGVIASYVYGFLSALISAVFALVINRYVRKYSIVPIAFAGILAGLSGYEVFKRLDHGIHLEFLTMGRWVTICLVSTICCWFLARWNERRPISRRAQS